MAVVECRNLTRKYGKFTALDQVNLSIEKGKIIGLLGPNGSGKTTLIKLANGLLTPTSGEILIDGRKPGDKTKALCAYLPDRDCLPSYMKAESLLKLYGDFYSDFDRARAEKMLSELGIDMNKRMSEMSKGMREKIQLSLVMSRRALVYWLDEPIGGVDPAARDFILQTILTNYSREASVVISTHLIADVESILDDVVFLKQGKIVLHENADTIREKKQMSVEDLFKEEFRCSENISSGN
ncbi:MAG: ABC transporter ATP-binding protein [Solobacterium sp.]|jgi:ABC-2 type transport system ATP-binding protein|nr:ABC transporter ATP-binding protein [Solobacterium sp.]MCH4049393.1 ABC transporter ATP-binding protein [Solobacterium sp.]MCH4075249.1 ABC transporter ATP-binding protein [Solobacterium sp.]MCI1313838.1 ABC transporter ATP-binding protein [Solobacterium sp.]MCI1407608.1 ABC transporter ATP-binding protein [Solobacterium sp.]